MSNFRTKILGLAALATAFAGMSFAQTITCPAANFTTVTINPTLRAEGETELVADAQAVCTTTLAPVGAVYASLSLPVTSKSQSGTSGNNFGGTAFAGNSDAVLQILTGGVTTYYPGTVSGTTVAFTGVAFGVGGAGFTATISNIRVNASTGGAPQVTENLLIQYTNGGGISTNVANTTPLNVGYILPSLSYALAVNGSNQVIYNGGTSSTFVTTCAGNPLSSTTPPTATYTVNIKELTANAFKLQTGAGSEQGSFPGTSGVVPGAGTTPNLASGVGTATAPTQIQVAFTNVPPAATVYLPVTITSGGTTLSLQGSVTALTTPASLVGLATSGVYGFTPTSGNITVLYSVTANSATGTTFALPVYLTVAANAAAVQTTAMTVAVSYYPGLTITGPQTVIPEFAVNTAAATPTITVVSCSTTLLFPYVTNATGFETGIAIANTTTDNLGTTAAKPSVSTPVSGTCTLNFYGNTATQPTAVVTPTLGVNTTTVPTVSPVYANTLTAASGVTNFTGYAIASCNFTEAHGFAFITDLSGQFSGAMGYLAVVVPNGRNEATGADRKSVV